MKAYKGFDKNMQCRGFQFEEGKTYEEDEAVLCKSGFHACENPLETFKYYEPGKGSVYHEVELDDVSNETDDDSKRVGKKITIGARLSVLDICKLHFQYVKERTKTKKETPNKDDKTAAAQDCSSLAAQDESSLAARNRSSLAAQDCSSLAAQDRSSLSAGENSVIAAFNSKAKGGKGTLIALANRVYTPKGVEITDFKAAIVDGVKIKENTWYKLENGEFVEVQDAN